MQVNHVAFGTTTTLAIATGGAVIAAAVSTATLATVLFSILGIVLGATTIASITAWGKFTDWGKNDQGENVAEYFEKVQAHLFYAIPGFFTFVSQVMVQALVQGIAEGVSKLITRKIAGADFTIKTN